MAHVCGTWADIAAKSVGVSLCECGTQAKANKATTRPASPTSTLMAPAPLLLGGAAGMDVVGVAVVRLAGVVVETEV